MKTATSTALQNGSADKDYGNGYGNGYGLRMNGNVTLEIIIIITFICQRATKINRTNIEHKIAR